MAVYVDKAFIKYRRMLMCHMIADTIEELHTMADKVGLKRKWFQSKASFPHYDICASKRTLAIQQGAVECDRREFVQHLRRIKNDQ